jgi:hypothetical protein
MRREYCYKFEASDKQIRIIKMTQVRQYLYYISLNTEHEISGNKCALFYNMKAEATKCMSSDAFILLLHLYFQLYHNQPNGSAVTWWQRNSTKLAFL